MFCKLSPPNFSSGAAMCTVMPEPVITPLMAFSISCFRYIHWRGPADQAHRIAEKYHADYVLSCPYSSTTTIFMAETPKGFYGQLQSGKVPGWLQPVQLPADSPYKMWKVVG